MEVRETKLVFTQPEVVHILWNHNSTPIASLDVDKDHFINEVAENYRQVRLSDSKDDNVYIDNVPPSRELLARRILRQEHSGIEYVSTSTAEQVAIMRELHRHGRSPTARMARRVMKEYERQLEQETED